MTQQLIYTRLSQLFNEVAQEFDLLAKTPVENKITLDFDYDQLRSAITEAVGTPSQPVARPMVQQNLPLPEAEAKPAASRKRSKRSTKAEVQSANSEAQRFTADEVEQAVQAVTVTTSWGEPEEDEAVESHTPTSEPDPLALVATAQPATQAPITDPLLQQMLNPVAPVAPVATVIPVAPVAPVATVEPATPDIDPIKAFQELITKTNEVVKNNPEAAKVKEDVRQMYQQKVVESATRENNPQIKSISQLSVPAQNEVLAACQAAFVKGCEQFGVSYD